MSSRLLPAALGSLLLASCTITSLGPESGPPRVESEGLIEGHAALGWRDEDRFLKLKVLDGESDGALAEVALWRLLRVEVGALGLGLGIGPFDLALGTLFYEPDLPRMVGERGPVPAAAPVEDCELCAREAGQE
ncbi:MAG TPA: hypothetical protein VF530_18370 [Planctomycetota bacterium]